MHWVSYTQQDVTIFVISENKLTSTYGLPALNNTTLLSLIFWRHSDTIAANLLCLWWAYLLYYFYWVSTWICKVQHASVTISFWFLSFIFLNVVVVWLIRNHMSADNYALCTYRLVVTICSLAVCTVTNFIIIWESLLSIEQHVGFVSLV